MRIRPNWPAVKKKSGFGNSARTVTLSSNSTGTVTFTPASPLTIPNGSSSVNFTYSAGTLTTVTDPTTAVTTYGYTTGNKLASVTGEHAIIRQ